MHTCTQIQCNCSNFANISKIKTERKLCICKNKTLFKILSFINIVFLSIDKIDQYFIKYINIFVRHDLKKRLRQI